jgi:hypothetical protein
MTANLLDFDLEGLAVFCEGLGERRFRATQLFRWIHQKGASQFDDMSDLAKSLREKLKVHAHVHSLPVVSQHVSADGTIKWLFDVGGGNAVETVFIPEDDRGTLCISSQAGCAVGCRFCSTGHQGFSRNLTTAEIIAELVELAKKMRDEKNRSEELGLATDEIAFYDAVCQNDSAILQMGDETLRKIAKELVKAVRSSISIDWNMKDSVRAEMRAKVKRLLTRYDYPPDKEERAIDLVLEQAELVAIDEAA